MEHRWGDRIAVDVRVRISSAGVVGHGRLRNASVSGAFVETSLQLATMSLVQIRIPRGAQRGRPHVDASGFVARKERNGVGIEWIELAALHPAELASSPWHPALRQRSGAAAHL